MMSHGIIIIMLCHKPMFHILASMWFITNMQNRLVHHLISTNLRSALPKCMWYRTRWWTLIWMFFITHKNIIRIICPCPCVPPVCMFVVNAPYKSALGHPTHILDKKCPCFACSLWTTKKWKMLGATLTCHGHRSPLCTMQHNAARWCTMQDGPWCIT